MMLSSLRGRFNRSQVLVACLLVFLSHSETMVGQKQSEKYEEGIVVSVIDGDTFILDSKERVRLVGVDAPEAHASGKLDRLVRQGKRNRDSIIALGNAATSFCRKHFIGKKVRLVKDAIQPNRDRYRRLLRYLELEDGADVGIILLKSGLAAVFEGRFSRRNNYLEAQRKAQRLRKGIWSTKRQLRDKKTKK